MGLRVGALPLAALLLLGGCGNETSGSDTTVQPGDPTSVAPTATASDPTNPPTTTGPDATTTTVASGPAGADLPDPCSLLTAADIATATGLPFAEGTFNTDLSTEFRVICDWIATGADFATAQVLAVTGADAYESSKQGAAEVFTLVDVDIPGADAAYATDEGSLIAMAVGDLFLQVAYIPPGPGNVLDQTEQLAAIAVANL